MSIDPSELYERIKAGTAPAILDVRSPAEFAAGHVPGASNVPFSSVWHSSVALRVPASDPVVVYCGHGPRAYIAAAALFRRGFRKIILLRGHMAGWRRVGLPETVGSR
jgi:rhodanese-related sulfurtransferase